MIQQQVAHEVAKQWPDSDLKCQKKGDQNRHKKWPKGGSNEQTVAERAAKQSGTPQFNKKWFEEAPNSASGVTQQVNTKLAKGLPKCGPKATSSFKKTMHKKATKKWHTSDDTKINKTTAQKVTKKWHASDSQINKKWPDSGPKHDKMWHRKPPTSGTQASPKHTTNGPTVTPNTTNSGTTSQQIVAPKWHPNQPTVAQQVTKKWPKGDTEINKQ